MLEYVLIAISTFFASLISFFSGFGLGTILMPVIAIFLPLPIAIALTAIIHLIHNSLKTGLLWKAIDWSIAIRFGSTALAASIPGALLLKSLSELAPTKEYFFLGIKGEFSVLHICIGLLLIAFATMETFSHKIYRIKNLFFGGAISGFFGGLSGNQGALRIIFLINTNLDEKAFIGTNAVIAVLVDIIRLAVYSLSFQHLLTKEHAPLLGIAVTAGAIGVFLGMVLLRKIIIAFIQKIIIALLYLLGALLTLGIIRPLSKLGFVAFRDYFG